MIKRILTAWLILLMAMVNVSCASASVENNQEEQNVEAAETTEAVEQLRLYTRTDWMEEWEGYTMLTFAQWTEVYLAEESAEKYPALDRTLRKWNTDRMANLETDYSILTEASKEAYAASAMQEEYQPETIIGDLFVKRADSRALSFLLPENRISGYDYYEGVNLDAENGKELTLSDVFMDTTVLPERIAKALQTKYPGCAFHTLEDTLQAYLEQDDFSWILGYEGVTFYFAPYEIMDDIDTALTAELWFDDDAELFYETYLTVPKQYTVQIDTSVPFSVDLDETDGKADELLLSYTAGEEGYGYQYQYLDVFLNGEWCWMDDRWVNRYRPYLVHTEQDGMEKDLLFIEMELDNGYSELHTYELRKDDFVPTGCLEGTEFHTEWSDADEVLDREVFTIPERFTMDTWVETLSTIIGTAEYTVDWAQGTAVMLSEAYDLTDFTLAITTMIPIEAFLLPQMERAEIPAGEDLYFLRGDKETYVDMRTNDGSEYRIEIDCSEWPAKVNGKDIMECFDHMMFAG